MKLLVTNDDGITSDGIIGLAKWATRLGEVTVAAPKREQSGKSHAIDLAGPFEVLRVPFPCGITAYSVDSTPADCVRFMYFGLGERFDLVLSGINNGMNIGTDIVYSGTVGAVLEAACLGMKGVAVSTVAGGVSSVLSHLDRVYDYIAARKLLERTAVCNVNIPSDAGEIRITRQGGPYYHDNFVLRGNNLYSPEGYLAYKSAGNPQLDTDAVMQGFVSVSPLTCDYTDLDALRSLL